MKRWPLYFVLLMVLSLVACAPEEAPPPPLPGGSDSLARGQQLAEGFAACGFCHSMGGKPGAPLSGGRMMRDIFGDVAAPNITVADSGIGAWSESDVRSLLRSSKRADGTSLYSSFHKGFGWMSDADLTAVITFLRSSIAVDNTVERRDISFIERNTTGFFTSTAEVRGYVPQIAQSFRTEYGEYLTNSVAGCARCHSKVGGLFDSEQYLAGGDEISFDGESKTAPNITQSKVAGIGAWSDDNLKQYLVSGVTPAGREVDKRFCPVDFYQHAPSAEIDAVVAYLRTVPAIDEVN